MIRDQAFARRQHGFEEQLAVVLARLAIARLRLGGE